MVLVPPPVLPLTNHYHFPKNHKPVAPVFLHQPFVITMDDGIAKGRARSKVTITKVQQTENTLSNSQIREENTLKHSKKILRNNEQEAPGEKSCKDQTACHHIFNDVDMGGGGRNSTSLRLSLFFWLVLFSNTAG